ncbi:transcriptional regulator RcsA [Erwinia sp. B116]|uniref:transcriptional regulator RcsA n=1 Tax=Erwinia sp. B116 TaxID=1561024 RepID=UPI000C781C4E|nr:transcriptional regulator RcsA [Erwinia sp. B116]PLV61853.1 hypothetical protein NV64_07090 [Erwinia sp. B116]
MQAIVIDPCNYTLTGLTHYFSHINIFFARKVTSAQAYCTEYRSGLVFVSENCLSEDNQETQELREMIASNADFIFLVFMSTSARNFKEHVFVRENLVFLSKHIGLNSLKTLVDDYLKKDVLHPLCNDRQSQPVKLSRTESVMLEMWMSCHSTPHISDELNIKNKTIAAHKGNIKRKIKTNSKQIIHHVFRLANKVSGGICVDRERFQQQ